MPPPASPDLFGQIIALSPAAIAVLEGPEHRYTVLNDAYRALARGKGELVGRTLAEVWPEAGPEIVRVLDGVFTTGVAFQAERQPFHVVRDQGPEVIWLTFSFLPMRDAAGRVQRILVMTNDVTQHVRAMAALEASQELTAALSSAHTRADVARTVFEKGLAVFGADAGALALACADAPEHLELVEQYGYPAPLVEAWRRFPLALPSPVTGAVRAGEAVWVSSRGEALARFPLWATAVLDQPDHAWAALPLRARGKVLGALALAYHRERAFGAEYRELLLSLSERCAQALDRAQALDDVRARAAELETVLATVPVPVFLTRDAEARRIEPNRAAQALLQLAPGQNASLRSEPAGRPAFVPMRDGAPLHVDEMPMQAAARFGREVRDLEYDIVLADGTVRRVVANAQPIVDATGRRHGAVGAFVDVTARREMERAVREREARLRAFVEADLFGVFQSDVEGTFLECNEAFARLLGRTRDEVRARAVRWREVTPAEDRAADARAVAEARAQGRCTPYEKRYLRPDGTLVPVEIGFVLLEPDRRHAIGFVLDLTARKAAEEELRESDRRKSEFIAVLSHELRTPLTPIRNAVRVLEGAPAGSEEAHQARGALERQTGHLARLVDDLLDVARIEHGTLLLERTRLDLRGVVRDAVADHRAAFDRAQVAVRTELAAPVWVDGDRVRLAQLAGNLLENAAKFTGPGGRVDVSVRAAGDTGELVVRDTGAGIEPEHLPRLFEPFAQAPQGLARTLGGLGLGLALVRRIAELHGGAARAFSDGAGRGATFVVTLPAAAEAPTPAPTPRPARAPVPSVGPRRILVIEDNEDAATSLADVLALDGHEVTVALQGAAGVALARQFVPDVVLCDLGLPDIDGFEVARRLRGEPSLAGTRLVALSGYAQPSDVSRACAAGFAVHLSKPPDIDLLRRLLAE